MTAGPPPAAQANRPKIRRLLTDLKRTPPSTDAEAGKDAENGMPRAMRINELKDRVAQSAYVVDADAVAAALLRHSHARQSLLGCLGFTPRGAQSPSAGSPRRHPGI